MYYFKLEFNGYGTETVVGSITESQYNYWIKNCRLSKKRNFKYYPSESKRPKTSVHSHQPYNCFTRHLHCKSLLLHL